MTKKNFCFLLVLTFQIYGQSSQVEEYEFLMAEASLFLIYYQELNDSSALLDSAQSYAAQSDYLLANIFLEEFLALNKPQSITIPDLPKTTETKIFEFNISTGLDFNKQEFELGYLQTDSVITDEINKPFIRIESNINLYQSQYNYLKLQPRIRLDKENTTLEARILSNYKIGNSQIAFNGSYSYDKNKIYPEYSYQEINSSQRFNWKINEQTLFRFNNLIRYKKYTDPSQTIPNFINNNGQIEISHQLNQTGRIAFNYNLIINESLNETFNDYLEHNFIFNGTQQLHPVFKLDYATGIEHIDFYYGFQDSLIDNKANSYYLNLQSEFDIIENWELLNAYDIRYKNYQLNSEEEPDYLQHLFISKLRYNFTHQLNINVGYQYESKNHLLFENAQDEYIKEQNYFGNGVVCGLDYFNLNDLLISFNASYSWRRYPQSNADSWNGLYANRNILNINVLTQIPISQAFQFNLFLTYDNDQDLDSDAGNTRSSFFSAELEYHF